MKEEEYLAAVRKLAVLAKDSTDVGRAAAQVLLSACNSSMYQVAVADLCELSQADFDAAISVIVGRRQLRKGPQQMLPDNENVFDSLVKRWERLQARNRWKPSCKECMGAGTVPMFPDDPHCHDFKDCPGCDGKGW